MNATGGATFPTLPNPALANPPPEYAGNVDAGIVSFDVLGVLHTIDWQGFKVGVQYYLPPSGRWFVTANYTQPYSANLRDLFPQGGAEIELLTHVADRSQYVDANLFFDVTPTVRLGLAGAYTTVEYLDGEPYWLVVGAPNDSVAAGARHALAAARRRRRDVGTVHVTGCDGASDFRQRLVANGMLTATVLVPPVAGRAVDEVARMRAGGEAPPPEIILDVASYPELASFLGNAATSEAALRWATTATGWWPTTEPEYDDAELLARLQAGDHAAQTTLVVRYREVVRRVLTRILRKQHDVADALQDTFIEVFRSATQVKDPRALRVWVLRVAESVGLDEFRRRQRLRSRGILDCERLDLPAPGASPEVRGALRDAWRVLSCLPDEERAIFAMRFVEGLELAQIAQMCELSLATVKRRLGRAETRFMSLARRQPGLSEWVD